MMVYFDSTPRQLSPRKDNADIPDQFGSGPVVAVTCKVIT